MASFRELIVKIGADAKGLTGGIGSAVTSLTGLSSTAVLVGGAAAAAVAAIGVAAFKVGLDFEAANNTIRIGTGATGAALEGLQDSAKNVFKGVPENIGLVATVIADLNTLTGETGPTLEGLSKQVIDVSRLMGEDATTNAKGFGRVLQQFQEDADGGGQSLDFLFQNTQQFGVGLGEQIGLLEEYGAVLKNAGFSIDASAELMARLQGSGIDVSRVMPGLNAAFRKFAGAGLESSEALQQTIDEMLSAADASGTLTTASQIFGAEGAQRITTAVLNGTIPALDQLGVSAAGSTGAIADAAEKNQTFSDKLGILAGNIGLLLEPLGSLLVDGLGAMVDLINASVTPAVDAVGSGFSSVKSFLDPLVTAFVDDMAPALRLLEPLVVGIGSAFIEYQRILNAVVMPVLTTVADFVVDVFAAGITQSAANIQTAFDLVNSAIGSVKDFLDPLITTVVDGFGPGVELMVGLLAGVRSTIVGLLPTLDDIKAKFDTAAQLVGNVVAPAFDKVKTAFSSVAGFVRDVFIFQIEQAVKGFQSFIGFLEKIPGVKGLVEKGLGDMRAGLESFETATKGAGDEIKTNLEKNAKSVTKELDTKTEPAVTGVTSVLDKLGTSAKDAKVDVFNLDKALQDADRAARDFEKGVKDAAELGAKRLRDEVQDLGMDLGLMQTDGTAAVETLASVFSASGVLQIEFDAAAAKAAALTNELKAVGITPRAELDLLATKANEKFQEILNSGSADSNQVKTAWLNSLDDIKAKFVAQGLELPTELANTMRGLEGEITTFKTNTTGSGGILSTWASDVKGLTEGLSGDMLGGLFTDSGSFGDALGSKLEGLKTSFIDSFTAPIDTAIGNLIDTGLNALLGSLDDVIGKLTGSGGVASAFSSAFGGGGGSVPGVGGGGGGGGAASAAGSGVSGAIGVVSGVVSAVSGIIGNFQNARQETTLNAIEESTRRGTLFLGDRADQGILGVLFRINEEVAFGPNVKANEETRNRINDSVVPRLNEISAELRSPESIFGGIRSGVAAQLEKLDRIEARLRELRDQKIVVQIDGREVAAIVGDRLAAELQAA